MLDSGHLIYILLLAIVVLIIWGPNKLPELGSGMGRAIREFKKATQDTSDTLRSVMSEPPAKPATTPATATSPVVGEAAEQVPVPVATVVPVSPEAAVESHSPDELPQSH